MTRLKEIDVSTIDETLVAYDTHLREMTGSNLLDIAAHALSFNTTRQELPQDFKFIVIPVTSGLGRITGFSEAVVSILNFLGFKAEVSLKTDLAGLLAAYESDADGLFLADDKDYIAINLHTRKVVHNSDATGYGFAAALDLVLKNTAIKDALVIGCGRVGGAAAEKLLHFGFSLSLYDINNLTATSLHQKLSEGIPDGELTVTSDLQSANSHYSVIIEATPSATSLNHINFATIKAVAAAGVPTSLPADTTVHSQTRFIHDKLEIGTAVMALSLLIS